MRKLICAQTQTNDSIVVMYVITSALCLPLLTIPFRHAFPSSPVVTSSQGTREVAVICESPLDTMADERTYTFPSLNQNKSRRKSCQACAESKVKCDLKQPCTKCTSRGKECIFINDPAQSREKKAAAAARRKAAQKTAADASSISSSSPRLTPPTCNPLLYSSVYSYDVEDETEMSLVTGISSAFDISPTELLYEPSYTTTCPELSGGSTTTSSSMSPRSDLFDIAVDYYTTGPEVHMLDESLAKILPQDIVPIYPESSYTMQGQDFVHTPQGLLDFGYENQQWMMDNVLTACPPLDMDSYIAPVQGDASITGGMGLLNGSAPSSLLVGRETSPIDLSPKGTPIGPAEADLQHYCERSLSTLPYGVSQ